ncbi:MAG: hypothetical protein H7306_11785 [Bacteriovorax sp.]|nr:hypothetical protein [Rhizobacter sp.]
MLVVAQAHRGRGIGSALVRTAMGDDAPLTWVLRAGRGGVSALHEKLALRRKWRWSAPVQECRARRSPTTERVQHGGFQ